MKIRHLQILVAVVEHRGISRASDHLNVSQPAVSAAIRSLEDELGVPLFERANSSKGVRPNGRAMTLYHHARDILRRCDEAKASVMRPDERPPKVSLGILHTLAPADIAKAHSTLVKIARQWRWSVREGAAIWLSDALEKRQIDLAWGTVNEGEPHSRVLWREPFVAIVAKDHPIAKSGRTSIRIGDLDRDRIILRGRCELPRNALQEAGLAIRPAARADRDELALALAAQGLGFVIAPRSLATVDVAVLPVDDLDLVRSIGLRWHKQTPPALVEAATAALAA